MLLTKNMKNNYYYLKPVLSSINWGALNSTNDAQSTNSFTSFQFLMNRKMLLWMFIISYFFVQIQFSSVQSLSHVRLLVTPWIAACQALLSITNSQSLLKLMSIESMMPSSHLILCRPLLLGPSIFPSIRVFSNESVLCIRWPKY